MNSEKLDQLNTLSVKISDLKSTLSIIRGKTKPVGKNLPWNLVEGNKQAGQQVINFTFKGGSSDAIDSIQVLVPLRLAEPWLADIENYYASELRIAQSEFERL